MTFPSPNLDDRTFEQLLEDAKQRIKHSCPDWTDLSPADPGMALLEAFAYQTETMIYRLNRLPEKVYIELLRLINVRIQPPAAAQVTLQFRRSRPEDVPLNIKQGTRVTTARTSGEHEPLVFITSKTATIEAGQDSVEVTAYHCEQIEGELVGKGTGLPGLSVTAARPPIIAPTEEGLELIVGVETEKTVIAASVREFGGKVFQIWHEVEHFSNLGKDRFVYLVDRISGTISFAPAVNMQTGEAFPQALAEIPPAGKEIRLWYRRGGGPTGNVAANTLTVLKDAIAGLQVTNPKPAQGGRAAETLENAMRRGPLEIHSLQRAVTARDFEGLAMKNRGVARALAFTKAQYWKHAQPGTVEVLLVPKLPQELLEAGRITIESLHQHQDEATRRRVKEELEERKPLGTICLVNWVRYKRVQVKARVVVHKGIDPALLKAKLLTRLYQTINPLPNGNRPGWRFGQALRISDVYNLLLSEPGVSYVDNVLLQASEMPEKNVNTLAADEFQPGTTYAGSDEILFRSTDEGDSWEAVDRFPNKIVGRVKPFPVHQGNYAGLVAVLLHSAEEYNLSSVYIYDDYGETWGEPVVRTSFRIHDMAWLVRNGVLLLMLATDVGLYELSLKTGALLKQVDSSNKQLGFYAIAIASDVRGQSTRVALAAKNSGGIFLAVLGNDVKSNTFKNIGLKKYDIRVLKVQYTGSRLYLWAGATVYGAQAGKGCFRLELREEQSGRESWQHLNRNWKGGSCHDIAFLETKVLAATHSGGVLSYNVSQKKAAWETLTDSHLPRWIKKAEKGFIPLDAIATHRESDKVLVGGRVGVYRSQGGDQPYSSCSSKEFSESVSLPDNGLFCSDEHELTVEVCTS
jgi:hypothetical protein